MSILWHIQNGTANFRDSQTYSAKRRHQCMIFTSFHGHWIVNFVTQWLKLVQFGTFGIRNRFGTRNRFKIYLSCWVSLSFGYAMQSPLTKFCVILRTTSIHPYPVSFSQRPYILINLQTNTHCCNYCTTNICVISNISIDMIEFLYVVILY